MSREALLRRIADEGRVTFRDAMDAALNDEQDGWYGAGKASIGAGGDFTTSPELSPVFGACVASWVREQWERRERPAALHVGLERARPQVLRLGLAEAHLLDDALGVLVLAHGCTFDEGHAARWTAVDRDVLRGITSALCQE